MEEALDDEHSQDEAEDTLLVGFEETLASEKLSGPVEFLVYAGSDAGENGPIRFVCEAKPSLDLYWGKATWQFLAQLTTAAQTWGSEEVYGALTDALEWHFFRIRKLTGDKWVIEAAMPLCLADSVFFATDASRSTVTMLLQSLFAKQNKFNLPDLAGSLNAADEDIKKWAKNFTEQAGKVSELLDDNQKKDAEIAKNHAEIAKLKAQLEEAR